MSEPRKLSRRKFLRWALGAGLAAGVTGAGSLGYYACGVEPNMLAVEGVRVYSRHIPPALHGLTIAHLSDLHWGPYTGRREIQAAVERANALVPDLVALTGDFVYYEAQYAAPCARALAALRAPLGVYAVPGNHDQWAGIDAVAAPLRAAGVTLLRNESRRLEVNGAPLWLAGLDDVLERQDDLVATLSGIPEDEPILFLVHEPDFADEAARDPHQIVLQLSGHSHGGQVNLPLLGPPLLPWLGQKYPAGLKPVLGSGLQVYTNRGIGLIAPPVRFNCRPEVTLLTLVRGV
jgi:predicted MPP superfamily phosphohydrolase